ncbi:MULTISPECIES: winged helix-turn-helix domain-containing protein [unclassified Haloferax]|uniref:helix-turn-helix transcriptional regulator n=1 Tax=unclassified Haloferax TaxID=2625095 RepID=UPI00287544DC|nr:MULTISPECIES: winged helix-turn-helix domain-containing protein [unclassified Haloferax]MDS0243397.1 winged helix-turn-helix domain-containing protein [Haloferax sp. S2CR25]MDS0446518.1 winged helix-turn-helix domain-containing protein [Haloferax sp. S2CR25-2]
MEDERFAIVPSPTSSGKSYNGAATYWMTEKAAGDSPVIQLHATKDSRKEAVEMSREEGVASDELLGREEACACVRGEHDDEIETPTGEDASVWLNNQVSIRGNTLSNAHSYLEDENGGELPCSPCPSVEQWKGVPRDEDGDVTADVVHATHNFAYVPSLTDDANIFFDEQPNFKNTIGDDNDENADMTRSRFQDIVTAWLKKIDAPAKSWEMFVALAKDGGFDEVRELLANPPRLDIDWFITGEGAHAMAPALTEAAYDALSSEPDQNGRRVGRATSDITRFDGNKHEDFRYSRTRITLIVDDDNIPTVYWNVPELGNARSIICLDAWPSVHEWKQNVGENLDIEPIVDDEEFVKWRKLERGLEVVQIGEGAKPASTEFAVEEYTNPTRQKIVVESLRNEYGEAFRSAIYPNAMDNQIQAFLPDDFRTMTHGNVKSNNAFTYERVGLTTNSIDPGDDYVLDLLAARGLNAEPETWDCIGCDDNDPNCYVCEGEPNRKPGRKFVGPDAEAANEMLAGVRENAIAQAVGRWARKTDSPRAIVFVRTSAVPDILVDTKIDDAWEFSEKQRAVVDYVRQNVPSSVSEIVKATGVSNSSVNRTLKRLVECGVAQRGEISGEFQYMLTDEIPDEGLLDLSSI